MTATIARELVRTVEPIDRDRLRALREDARGRRDGAFPPLGPEAIEARADALPERIAAAA